MLDAYNRHLAYVLTEDGQCVNAALVRDGLARVSARLPLTRLPELQRAEAEAQAARRGMWGGAPRIPSPGYTGGSAASPSPSSRSRTPASKRRKTRTKNCERYPCRVRVRTQDPRIQQAVLPV